MLEISCSSHCVGMCWDCFGRVSHKPVTTFHWHLRVPILPEAGVVVGEEELYFMMSPRRVLFSSSVVAGACSGNLCELDLPNVTVREIHPVDSWSDLCVGCSILSLNLHESVQYVLEALSVVKL